MLGVFGIDIYDDFQGAYQFDRDYGVFRYADRRIVQGMKLWTFGYGPRRQGPTSEATPTTPALTSKLQSGRHVWDGHYEWVGPHKVEGWSEWWVPVAGTRRPHHPDPRRRAEPRSGQRDRQNHAGRDPPNPAREAAGKRTRRRDRTG